MFQVYELGPQGSGKMGGTDALLSKRNVLQTEKNTYAPRAQEGSLFFCLYSRSLAVKEEMCYPKALWELVALVV